ncbi:hypothetical protein [Arthrobacter sp. D5-1]|uniref:hypothetical protein n=1 Tax=Arthrobacter sp. D5-1 TaxID=1477518 RepID=UPI001A97E5D3|nr:hypothetical protein [Arthrobacter sp. D5-1]QSZ47248.1 hypothetical protein AYX22_01660 [Arthrobacter sp. D5-1]
MPKSPRKKVAIPEGGWQAAAGKHATPQAIDDVGSKRAVVLDVDQNAVLERKLVWRFNQIDREGQWSPTNIASSELGNLFDKMASFETMTIGEIFAPGSEHGKSYEVSKMPAPSQRRLQDIERDDETEIVRLRCGGAPRLYGFLREHIFHILWWDPRHEVWPSSKN